MRCDYTAFENGQIKAVYNLEPSKYPNTYAVLFIRLNIGRIKYLSNHIHFYSPVIYTFQVSMV